MSGLAQYAKCFVQHTSKVKKTRPKYCDENTTRTVVRGVQLLRHTLSCMRLICLFVCLAGTPGSEGSSSESNKRVYNRVKSPISPEELVPTITHDQRQQVPLENQVLLFRSSESSYQSLPHDSLIRHRPFPNDRSECCFALSDGLTTMLNQTLPCLQKRSEHSSMHHTKVRPSLHTTRKHRCWHNSTPGETAGTHIPT
jgi:hypothetical protein